MILTPEMLRMIDIYDFSSILLTMSLRLRNNFFWFYFTNAQLAVCSVRS